MLHMFRKSDKKTVLYVPFGYWFICVETEKRRKSRYASKKMYFETEKDTEKRTINELIRISNEKEGITKEFQLVVVMKKWIWKFELLHDISREKKQFFERKKHLFRKIYSNSIIYLIFDTWG